MKIEIGMIVRFAAKDPGFKIYRGIGRVVDLDVVNSDGDDDMYMVDTKCEVPDGYGGGLGCAIIKVSEMRLATKAEQTLFAMEVLDFTDATPTKEEAV